MIQSMIKFILFFRNVKYIFGHIVLIKRIQFAKKIYLKCKYKNILFKYLIINI